MSKRPSEDEVLLQGAVWTFALLVFATTLSTSFTGTEDVGLAVGGLLHGALFAGLGALAFYAVHTASRQHAGMIVVAVALVTATLEVLQGLVAPRGLDLLLFAAGTTGSIVGVVLALWIDRGHRLRALQARPPVRDPMGDWWRWGHEE